MDITQSSLANRAQFIQNFDKWIEESRPQDHQQEFRSFVREYLLRFPLGEWEGRHITDLYGLSFGLYHHLKHGKNQGVSLSVFNPSLDEHGWQCGRTIIFIQQPDMPFLVDSVRIALNRREIPIYLIKSTVLNVDRRAEGMSISLSTGEPLTEDAVKSATKEALMYIEVSLQPNDSELYAIHQDLLNVLADVAVVVSDHQRILQHLEAVRDNLDSTQQQREEVEFSNWLMHRHFAFLGYRDYDLITHNNRPALQEDTNARLGVFKRAEIDNAIIYRENFSPGMQDFYASADAICFSKAATHSSVHRSAYPDYVVFKKYDTNGNVTGEVRFLGLFTYEVLTLSPLEIPILRTKVQKVINRSGLDPNSHDGRSLRRTVENYPRAELFLTDTETLHNNIMSIVEINERHLVRLIARCDAFGNFITCNVFVPRDIYSTSIRQKIQDILSDTFDSNDFDFNTFFSESNLVRAQFIYRVTDSNHRDFDLEALEERVVDVTRNWSANLRTALIESFGESNGIRYFNLFKNGFTPSYQEHFDTRYAVQDIKLLETLKNTDEVAMNFYQPIGVETNTMRFRVLHLHNALILSDIIPILENLGLKVIGENPFQIYKHDGSCVWLHDFQLNLGIRVSIDVHAVKNLFEQAFAAVWSKRTESDSFNKLVLGAKLHWREVSLLRAYAGYMKQTGFNADQNFIAETLSNHTEITRNLLAVYKSYFDPRLNTDSKGNEREGRIGLKIVESLDDVANLNEDRVLRRFLELIEGTLRTNYFQSVDGQPKDYIVFKFSPRDIVDIPEPRPLYEIYVYSPRVEGVHLRGGKVARGGLRWSDRLQDYRTEVLGLVKAQHVKNAVIVPHGAKGGFVAKHPPAEGGRDAILGEGIACYQLFIRGLLDVTDNLVEGSIVPPKQVVRRDDDDPYLVVAADKGTATFSDIANKISLDYNHWLGDAFASGGSQGYDHKGMGITAKGAWVSVQRHFREMGKNIQQQAFTVIGIGDMAGDVFGNGMLLSEHICLQAAFNHLHLFIDPTPNATASFIERKRLFETPRTSWADYNAELISEGGGIYERSVKYITLTPQMKSSFSIDADRLTPTELIHSILKAPVDLIWNGGIGTYIKSKTESHNDVGDKANDTLRVNGEELRCKVFGEGGNLGMTQLGRIEFCLNGGACNTDFIDNAAGVDCSDHEVNIKILLDEKVASGDLTAKQRNTLLSEMTSQVSDLVLQNNYRQTQAISIAQFQSAARSTEYRRFISFLESTERLNRALEFIPTDEQIVERQGHGKYLSRPELSVLISYAKVMMKEELINSNIADDDYIAQSIESAFPQKIVERYHAELYGHRLRKEIVGTQVANDLINNLGITVGHRLLETTGASSAEIARAYIVSRDVFDFENFQRYIKSLDHQVAASLQAELMGNMIRRVRRGTRWFLRNRRTTLNPETDVAFFKQGLNIVYRVTAEIVSGDSRAEWLARSRYYEENSVPEEWSLKLAMPDNLFSGLGVIESARVANADITVVTEVFFELLDRLDLNWFATLLSEVKVDSYWQALARESYIDDLEAHIRQLTVSLVRLKTSESSVTESVSSIDTIVNTWFSANELLIVRWKKMITEVQSSPGTDYAMFAVALRELLDLVVATEHYVSTQYDVSNE
ncbi:NAD-glutamate dehydrogenase [Teredinibacter purpureus]|uniref:NAD-glutamate dehydrogenase n=1 Tax=Teredinibacter purpureus TaxID=2731756 RepID=UPI0005F7CA79|nr:NAD-glutamate dehydrogenase [Teredinibacter purpureus]